MALHGFEPVRMVKEVIAPQKPIADLSEELGAATSPSDGKPQDQCSELTEIDAATEPLHSDESPPEQLSRAEPELDPPGQPAQQPLAARLMQSPHLSPKQRERQCGELFHELGVRLGHIKQSAQDVAAAVLKTFGVAFYIPWRRSVLLQRWARLLCLKNTALELSNHSKRTAVRPQPPH